MSKPSINNICNEAADATTEADTKKKKEGKQTNQKNMTAEIMFG